MTNVQLRVTHNSHAHTYMVHTGRAVRYTVTIVSRELVQLVGVVPL